MTHGNVPRRAWQGAKSFRMPALSLLAGLLLTASGDPPGPGAGVSLKVLDASAPPGGTMQLAVEVTEPIPISTGSAGILVDTAVLGPVMGVALYGPAGAQSDAAGTAVASGNRLTVRTVSPSSAFGTSTATPILAVTMGVRADALPGAQASLQLDPAASSWTDPAGALYPQQIRNGTFQVGGTVSIHDVFPGTGLLPAGFTVVIRGMGFKPGALLEIDGVAVASATVVSDTEVQATLGVSADLYGRRVRVKNLDLSSASYRAYLRAQWIGRSSRTLLADTDPIFSPVAVTGAFFTASPSSGQFFGLALQNPAATAADVTVELRSRDSATVASTAVTLPARTRISREVPELFAGQPMPAGGVLVVRSSAPVQMLGLLGDETAGRVEPVLASLAFP